MKWEFEEYGEDSTRQDSSSDKFFKEASESDSLIREFIQNSLDAGNNSETEWKNSKFPELATELIEQNSSFFLDFEIKIPTKQGVSEIGTATLLIKKEEDNTEKFPIDFWRDNLLITEAINRGKKQKGYLAIFIISDNPIIDWI